MALVESLAVRDRYTVNIPTCFGYAAVIHARPPGYSFLPEFEHSLVQQISIETAQSNLDCSILEKLPDKTIILGVIDLSDMSVEAPETVAGRIRRALKHVLAERIVVAPDCGIRTSGGCDAANSCDDLVSAAEGDTHDVDTVLLRELLHELRQDEGECAIGQRAGFCLCKRNQVRDCSQNSG